MQKSFFEFLYSCAKFIFRNLYSLCKNQFSNSWCTFFEYCHNLKLEFPKNDGRIILKEINKVAVSMYVNK